jgi:predicted AlkP superfamily phosphohydrolase/phosphomutase
VDKGHPLYDPEFGARYGDTLKALYAEVDAQLGKVLDQFDLNDPNNVVMIMSDHGFGSFRRQVNLNTWLFKKGYLAVSNPRDLDGGEHFSKVNWQRTGVYNLGINCLYLNQKGREKNGVVEAGQRKSLLSNLERDLKAMVDPATGNNAVTYVATVSDEVQARHPNAPDIIVGWGHGYRTSWDSILGGFQPEIFTDNDDKWSGDHCIDPRAVPALFMSNRTVDKPDAKLADIAPTILAAFGLTPDDETEGSSLFTG